MKITKGCIRGGPGNYRERVWCLEFETQRERDAAYKELKPKKVAKTK